MPLCYHPIVEHLNRDISGIGRSENWSDSYANGKKMDAGPIIGQVDVPVGINEDGISLGKLATAYVPLLRTHSSINLKGQQKKLLRKRKEC